VAPSLVDESETTQASRTLADGSRPSGEPVPEPTDAELERGILDAVSLGLGDVARTLAGRLEERRRARAGNVVALDPRRREGR
jgi:hypothetical protein